MPEFEARISNTIVGGGLGGFEVRLHHNLTPTPVRMIFTQKRLYTPSINYINYLR